METVAADFLTTIASKRIRVHRHDWQGLRVDALLWHLPHLKPAAKSALLTYITGQWGIASADTTALPPTREPVMPAAPMAPDPQADRSHETGGGYAQAEHTPDNATPADAGVALSGVCSACA